MHDCNILLHKIAKKIFTNFNISGGIKMNLSINSVNFTGKEEVIYGLRKAAKETRKIGVNIVQMRGPHPVTRENEINRAHGALNAYADMIVNDSQFESGIKKAASDKDIINEIKDNLKPVPAFYGQYDSLYELFTNNILTTLKHSGGSVSENLQNFFEKIK